MMMMMMMMMMMKCNCIHYTVWDEITYPFPNINDGATEVCESISYSFYTLLDMWLLIHAGIKVNPCY